jgi:hypothetical protein
MTLKTLSFSDGIIFHLPSGKPDHHLPKPDGVDERARIFQKGTVGLNCFFYATHFLRDRIGKNAPGFEQMRAIEKAGSTWRKQMVQLPIDDEQDPNFSMKTHQKQKEVHEVFLKQLGHDPQKLVDEYLDGMATALTSKRFGTSSLKGPALKNALKSHKAFILETFKQSKNDFSSSATACIARTEWALACNLKPSDLSPHQTADELSALLVKEGPIIVCGYFGRSYYTQSPILLDQTFNGYELYSWPHFAKQTPSPYSHAIILVGVCMHEGSEQVYFLDPNDDSPADEPRKLYTQSLDTFHSHLLTLMGCRPQEFMGLFDNTLGFYKTQSL